MKSRVWLYLYVLLAAAQSLAFGLLPQQDYLAIALAGVAVSLAALGVFLRRLSKGGGWR